MKPVEQKDYQNYVYDVDYDEKQNRLLFAGIEGAIRFFNLKDNSTGILFKPPGDDYIWQLRLSTDGMFICCFCTPPVDNRNKKSNSIRIWNYPALTKAAGLE